MVSIYLYLTTVFFLSSLHSYLYFHASLWDHFPSEWRIPLSIYFNTACWWYILYFCLFKNIFISLLLLKGYFQLVAGLFFEVWNYCFIAFIVSIKNQTNAFWLFIQRYCIFLLWVLLRFSFWFSTVCMWCAKEWFSLFYTALRLRSFLSLFIDIFHQFWKTICHISSNIFSSSLFPFFPWFLLHIC